MPLAGRSVFAVFVLTVVTGIQGAIDVSVDLAQQTVVVIGASSGMGRATALAFAKAGARVFAVARRADRLESLATAAAGLAGTLTTIVADTTVPADVERVVDTASQSSRRLDTLVYCTGANTPDRSLDRVTPEIWSSLLEANLTGAFLCTKAALPTMRAQGGGLIVYLSSAAVQMPDVSGVAYQASKHGLVGLAHGTRVEEKAHGIRTTVVFPGLCDTEILNARPVPTPQDVLSRALDPDDVAETVLFLARLPARAVVPELQLLPARI